MKNKEIADIFRAIAAMLQIKGENVFRIRAYERGAQNLDTLSEDCANLLKENRLMDIPGIGKDLAGCIKEYLETGRMGIYEELKKSIPQGVLEFLSIPSVGPKTAYLFYDTLKIKNIAELEAAIAAGKLNNVFGIKQKTLENILNGIALLKKVKERMTLGEAHILADAFVSSLRKLPAVESIDTAGSLRRQKETVRDIDILITSPKPQAVMKHFISLPEVAQIQAHGATKSSIRTKGGIQVDCRVVEKTSFGAALVYFTGSKNFNIKLRQRAMKKGLKINEYGVYKGNRFLCGKTEEEIFSTLGLSFIPPEMREDSGEIELAAAHNLPSLVELKDIKGDLHAHSTWSDGEYSVADMGRAAQRLGYRYIALTDHSQSLKVARGLSIADVMKKKREIERLNSRTSEFRILFGAEVDISSNGAMDYPDRVLKEFDIVIGAIHGGFKQPRSQLTKRMVCACKNKYVNIIAHPTSRLWGERVAYDIDLEEVFKVCRETNTYLEINSYPRRLDLNDFHSRRAKELGCKLAINTDSHATDQLAAMRLGVAVARRAWLTPGDVINTLSLEKLLKALRKS